MSQHPCRGVETSGVVLRKKSNFALQNGSAIQRS